MDYSEFMIFAEYVQNWQNAILQFQRGKGTVQCPHFNGMWNESTFQGPSNVIVRSCSQFEVWSGSPSAASPPSSPSPPSVLLFGFAGSKKHQLEKHSKLYNELGYQTLYCILPLQHLFHYDVHKIRQVWKNKTWPGANKNHFALQKPQIVTAKFSNQLQFDQFSFACHLKSVQGLCQLGIGRSVKGTDGESGLPWLLKQRGGALSTVHPCSCSARRCEHSFCFLLTSPFVHFFVFNR